MKEKGECHICGSYGQLSFDHVPPKAAYNKTSAYIKGFNDLISEDNEISKKGKLSQKGLGDFTLCPKCNNNTGQWYGKYFVDWVRQGMRLLLLTKNSPTLSYQYHIFPLPIIKQIICMFLSINSTGFRSNHLNLVKFVLSKNERYIPDDTKIFTFYQNGKYIRQTAFMAKCNINDSSKNSFFSEIVHPPFGYILTFGCPPNESMFDISFFSKYKYTDYKELFFEIPVLFTDSRMPGDYRNQSQIDKDIIENQKYLINHPQ